MNRVSENQNFEFVQVVHCQRNKLHIKTGSIPVRATIDSKGFYEQCSKSHEINARIQRIEGAASGGQSFTGFFTCLNWLFFLGPCRLLVSGFFALVFVSL